ncbi:MAG: hypothetical protein H0U59_00750 [Gemmatimonadaceae bacterium]|nr:hypothetical protein [Gemmatimonadaceae bacterium]
MAKRKPSRAKAPAALKGKAARPVAKADALQAVIGCLHGLKADALQAVIDDLNELALRDDVPTSYAGRLTALANRLDTNLKRAGG